MLWDACRGKSYQKATEPLPLCLQIDVNLAIYYDCISKVSIFQGKGLDKRFLRIVKNTNFPMDPTTLLLSHYSKYSEDLTLSERKFKICFTYYMFIKLE